MGISLYGSRFAVRVVAVEIDLGVIVLVEEVIVGHPFAALAEFEAHIVGLVVLDHQSARSVTVIVDHIYAHLVSCTEAIVNGYPGCGLLVYFIVDLHLVRRRLRIFRLKLRSIQTARLNQGKRSNHQ